MDLTTSQHDLEALPRTGAAINPAKTSQPQSRHGQHTLDPLGPKTATGLSNAPVLHSRPGQQLEAAPRDNAGTGLSAAARSQSGVGQTSMPATVTDTIWGEPGAVARDPVRRVGNSVVPRGQAAGVVDTHWTMPTGKRESTCA